MNFFLKYFHIKCIIHTTSKTAPKGGWEDGAGMNELIKVDFDNERPAVSGRELHGFLEAETRYNDWFPRMCEYGFREGKDFNLLIFEQVQIEGKREVKRSVTDHSISIAMAKEIAMLQRTEKGKQARQYFIKIEEAWNDPDKVIERAQKILAARVAKLETENMRLTVQLDESKDYYTVKRVAKINGISWRNLSWKRLKNTSEYMQIEIKKVFDANYENVNAYHINVWMHEYPELAYG